MKVVRDETKMVKKMRKEKSASEKNKTTEAKRTKKNKIKVIIELQNVRTNN